MHFSFHKEEISVTISTVDAALANKQIRGEEELFWFFSASSSDKLIFKISFKLYDGNLLTNSGVIFANSSSLRVELSPSAFAHSYRHSFIMHIDCTI